MVGSLESPSDVDGLSGAAPDAAPAAALAAAPTLSFGAAAPAQPPAEACARDVAVLLALWDADDEFKWHFGGGADPWAWHGVGARDGRLV